jgi:hypothetical protein
MNFKRQKHLKKNSFISSFVKKKLNFYERDFFIAMNMIVERFKILNDTHELT